MPFKRWLQARKRCRRVSRSLFCLALLLAASPILPAGAQTAASPVPADERPFDFYSHGTYRPEILRPALQLGYEPGEFQTTYAQFETLLRDYQQHSERLRLFEIGKSPEHRTLYLLAISSPRNLARLDEIKHNAAALADPRQVKPGPELEQLFQQTPIIIWLSYSIHGNESAAFEAGIQVLYQLLASNDPAIVDQLEHAVILMNPCQNPDGHERFVTWYNAHGLGRPEPWAFEHTEPWSILGRLNHNFFDLNRDLLSISQPESQAAVRAFLDWHPQVLADHHGEVDGYFFPPAALPINPNLPRKLVDKWSDIFGRANAAGFDRYAWDYYVRDVYDLFYPGYWDSWSSLHGAIGMTYETNGGGTKGYRWSNDDGTVVTLREGIAKHLTASLSTVATAVERREEKLRDYREFFDTTFATEKRKYFLVPGPDAQPCYELASVLLSQGIEVGRLNAEIRIGRTRDAFGGNTGDQLIPAGAFVIDTAQTWGRMANALLEPDTVADPEFVRHQEQKRADNDQKGRNEQKKDFDFYEVTAWSLPLAYGVAAFSTEDPLRYDASAVEAAEFPRLVVRKSTGDRTEILPRESLAPGVAYVFEPQSVGAMRLALTLLQKGFRVASASEPFHAGQRDFSRGTFIVRVSHNPKTLPELIGQLADKFGVSLVSVPTAYTDQGLHGLDAPTTLALKPPVIALLAGTPVEQTSYGNMLFLLHEKLGLEIVPVPPDFVDAPELDQFNLFLLPDGGEERYRNQFTDKQVQRLRQWIDHGGVLIGIGGAAAFLANPDFKLTSARLLGQETKEPEERPEGEGHKETPAEEKKGAKEKPAESLAVLPLRGAIFRAKVNPDHFLTIGYENSIPVPLHGDKFFSASTTGANVLTLDAEKLLISGFAWRDNTEQTLRGSSVLIDEPIGHGHLLLFNTQPGFRMFWLSTVRLLLNAITYAPVY